MKNSEDFNSTNERKERVQRVENMREKSQIPYLDKYDKTHSTEDIKNLDLETEVKTAGRLMRIRDMGKIAFADVQDSEGQIQLMLRVEEMGEEEYNKFIELCQLGDFVGVKGAIHETKKGELSVLVENFTFLSKALRPIPDKWHGLEDTEKKYRQRYLDLISNEDSRDIFEFKSDFLWELRKFYREEGFREISTPIMNASASGALAKPFKTHHNAMDQDLYLRIAPEIRLKEAIIGNHEKIFEVAKSFRNEGVDPSHLQEFTMVEHYSAYWDYKDNMKFTEKMLTTLIKKLKKDLEFEILDRNNDFVEVDFSGPWDVVTFRQLILKDCGIDIDKHQTAEDLRKKVEDENIKIEDIDSLGRGNLIDELYKEVSRPNIKDPVFLTEHPIDMSPLARKNDENPNVADRFQLVVNGWEVVNAYSELIDPLDQKNRFKEQAKAREKGDEEAMRKDNEYLKAMEYGMPPVSGWGMGVERIIALLTGQPNLKDVVMFPLMRKE